MKIRFINRLCVQLIFKIYFLWNVLIFSFYTFLALKIYVLKAGNNSVWQKKVVSYQWKWFSIQIRTIIMRSSTLDVCIIYIVYTVVQAEMNRTS